MNFAYDDYGNLIQSRLFLANPQKKYVGEISNVKELELNLSFNDMSECNFVVYEYENGEKNELYNSITVKRLIEVQYINWFEITEVSPTLDEDSLVECKRVKAVSLENKLSDKNIDDIDGVYSLYDISNTEFSLLHIISSLTNWKVGHIDNKLMGKKRVFSVDTAKIYNFLTTDVSKSFECVFKFNNYDRTINAYVLEDYGELTDIIIHGSNILKSYNRESSANNVVTKIKVVGGDGLDIRQVNPTGTNYLVNIDYFLTTEWMTQGTIDAYNSYKTAYNDSLNSFITARALLKTKLNEKNVLSTELVNLEAQKKQQEEIQGVYIKTYSGTPPYGTPEYTSYLNATNTIESYLAQISNKRIQISDKELEIINVENTIKSLNNSLNISNHLSPTQMAELNDFLTEGEVYEDATFIATGEMSDSEIIDMKIELMENASKELSKASRPQFTDSITANNLYTMIDDHDSPISYRQFSEKLEVGNLITIKFRDDYYSTTRLMKKIIKFDDLSSFELVFSDKKRNDDPIDQLSEYIANANKSSSITSLSKFGWDKASSMNSGVRDFINGTFDATLNALQSNDKQELYIDEFGLKMRRWLPDQNKYSDYQSWWNTNNLLFSSDGFKTVQTAIGLLTAPDGVKYYGVATDVLVGNFILGNKLKIINNSGTYTMDDNGLRASKNGYEVVINPNTPSEIFKISVDGSKKLYVDTVNNKLKFSGDLEGASGTFSGLISGGSININNNFLVDSNGIMTAKSGTFSGSLNAATGTFSGNLSAAGGTFTGTLQGVNGTFTGTLNGNDIIGANISGGTFTTTGLELSGNNIKLIRGFGKIIDSGGKSMFYADSSGNILISDYTSPANRINMYANEITLEPLKLKAITTTTSGEIEIGVFGRGTLGITSSLSSLTNNTEVRLQAPAIGLNSSGTTSITGSTKIGLTGNSITFRKSASGTEYSLYDLLEPNKIYADSLYYASLNAGREFIPSIPSTSSTECSLGNSTYPWKNLYIRNNIYHMSSGGLIGFFGTTPTTRKSVNKIASTSGATSSSNATKINELLTALAAYGIILST